jgi:predicted DNA-binding transcriptional regulator YafY
MTRPSAPHPSHVKAQRWLDLLAALAGAGSRHLSTEELMTAVEGYASRLREGDQKSHEAVRRTFERDKKELRELGIPLEMERVHVASRGEEIEAYRLPRTDFFLPYLKLVQESPGIAPLPGGLDPDDPGLSIRERKLLERLRARSLSPPGTVQLTADEAAVASEALRLVAELPGFPLASRARSALRKLRFDPGFPDAAAPVLFLERPGLAEEAETVRLISAALLERRRVRFLYHGMYRDQISERRVSPWGLLLQWGHWYLVGWDEDREDRRVFRVGRIEGCTVGTGAGKEYTIPEDFRLSDHLVVEPWALGGEDDPPLEVRVAFRFPRSIWAERNGHGEAVEGGSGDEAVRVFQVRQLDPFLRWILTLEGEARILSPSQVQAAFVSLSQAVLGRYAGGEP